MLIVNFIFSKILCSSISCCCCSILLVGKSSGDVEIWDVASAEKLFEREFMVKEATLLSRVFMVHLFYSFYYPYLLALVAREDIL